ncbi:hypothetical protein SAMN04488500_10632 [Sporomusa malonica]|uniref:Uncharacterized protein n=1 Tax=Sporomusa malonica TaxID=112901 RepID=A0A1W2AQB3_9FIRM|nr:hypothetical protein SAMN04488500_10632 [Sporomusa malonica]
MVLQSQSFIGTIFALVKDITMANLAGRLPGNEKSLEFGALPTYRDNSERGNLYGKSNAYNGW